MSYAEKELIKQLAKNPNIKIAKDAQNAIKSLFCRLIQQMLEAEMEEYLGYSKYKYILIACIDGLNSFKEAIKAVYPNTEVQRCIIHQIRNSSRYLSYKDIKAFNADLKLVYTAVNEDAALQALSSLEEKLGDKYLLAIKPCRNN